MTAAARTYEKRLGIRNTKRNLARKGPCSGQVTEWITNCGLPMIISDDGNMIPGDDSTSWDFMGKIEPLPDNVRGITQDGVVEV